MPRTRKPAVKQVPIPNPLAAPKDLSVVGADFWTTYLKENSVTELRPDVRSILHEVCRTHDAIELLQAEVATQGVLESGSQGQVVINPAVPEARQQRVLLRQLLTALNDSTNGIKSARDVANKQNATTQWQNKDTEARRERRLRAV